MINSLQIWKKLTTLGLPTQNRILDKKVQLSNFVAIIAVLNSLFCIFYFAKIANGFVSIVCFFNLLTQSLTLYLNYTKHFFLSRILLVYGIIAGLLASTIVANHILDVIGYFFAAIAIPFLVFRAQEKWPISLALVLSILIPCAIKLARILSIMTEPNIVNPAGLPLTFLVNALSIFSTLGLTLYFWFVNIQSEKKLRLSYEKISQEKKKTQSVMDSVEEAILMIDTHGLILPQFSHFTKTLFNLDKNQITGQAIARLIRGYVIEEVENLDKMDMTLKNILGGSLENFEQHRSLLITDLILNIDGVKKITRAKWQPIVQDRSVIGLLLILRDDSQYLYLEEQKRELQAKQRWELTLIEEIVHSERKGIESILEQLKKACLKVELADSQQFLKTCQDLEGNSSIQHLQSLRNLISRHDRQIAKQNEDGKPVDLAEMAKELDILVSDYQRILYNILSQPNRNMYKNSELNNLSDCLRPVFPLLEKYMDSTHQQLASVSIESNFHHWQSWQLDLILEFLQNSFAFSLNDPKPAAMVVEGAGVDYQCICLQEGKKVSLTFKIPKAATLGQNRIILEQLVESRNATAQFTTDQDRHWIEIFLSIPIAQETTGQIPGLKELIGA